MEWPFHRKHRYWHCDDSKVSYLKKRIEGHSIRKVENAVEETWSLRAAGFLLIGQLCGFLKFGIFCRLRGPRDEGHWSLPCEVLPCTFLPAHINRWSLIAKCVSVCTSYSGPYGLSVGAQDLSTEQELKVFQIHSKRLINSAGVAAVRTRLGHGCLGAELKRVLLSSTWAAQWGPASKSIPVWETFCFCFTWFCHCKYLVCHCGLF